ncbi:unnamed protein product [Eruca vesicaria subsp. sativa]|uniref:Uncharacterized protein n=1 Tax=Eruca vesicaria subsp. sativa TaxID=29727 RepID=A0ABC8JTT2_ERUVS|nr:unnamed protein product [Eruca vesicaria subsp. sativa]
MGVFIACYYLLLCYRVFTAYYFLIFTMVVVSDLNCHHSFETNFNFPITMAQHLVPITSIRSLIVFFVSHGVIPLLKPSVVEIRGRLSNQSC